MKNLCYIIQSFNVQTVLKKGPFCEYSIWRDPWLEETNNVFLNGGFWGSNDYSKWPEIDLSFRTIKSDYLVLILIDFTVWCSMKVDEIQEEEEIPWTFGHEIVENFRTNNVFDSVLEEEKGQIELVLDFYYNKLSRSEFYIIKFCLLYLIELFDFTEYKDFADELKSEKFKTEFDGDEDIFERIVYAI